MVYTQRYRFHLRIGEIEDIHFTGTIAQFHDRLLEWQERSLNELNSWGGVDAPRSLENRVSLNAVISRIIRAIRLGTFTNYPTKTGYHISKVVRLFYIREEEEIPYLVQFSRGSASISYEVNRKDWSTRRYWGLGQLIAQLNTDDPSEVSKAQDEAMLCIETLDEALEASEGLGTRLWAVAGETRLVVEPAVG